MIVRVSALLVLLLQVDFAYSVCTAALQATERVSQAVELKFYRVQADTWTSESNSQRVAVRIADAAQSYCASNAGTCGLDNCCSSSFKDSNVGSNDPENDKKDMTLKIYLEIPTGLNTTSDLQCTIPAAALQMIVEDAREGIHDDTGYWITYIDEEFYGIPPPSDLNAIIIPIACVVLLGIIILTFILHFWNKRREAAAKRIKIVEDRKKSSKSKVGPTYTTVNPEDPLVPQGMSSKNKSSQKPKRKDEMYRDNLLSHSQKKVKNASLHSEDSAIKVDHDPRQRQAYAYEKKLDADSRGADGYDSPVGNQYNRPKPLEQEPAQPESPEKKKKKKKKRSKSKENMSTGYENTGYDTAGEFRNGYPMSSFNNVHSTDN